MFGNALLLVCFDCYPVGLSCVQTVLPPHLEHVRDRLAENIHELWGMNKIELGWTYGKVKKKKGKEII